jgi:hypothetical protein
MRHLFKLLNPFIFLWNFFCYAAHHLPAADSRGRLNRLKVDPYDFSKDLRYF